MLRKHSVSRQARCTHLRLGMPSRCKLSDDELLAEFERNDDDERKGLVRVISNLMEIEARGIHRTMAYSSLFDFCVRYRGWSEGRAYRRILAARLARRHPDLLGRLERGEIHLEALQAINKHVTPDNYESLIKAVSRRSKREINAILVDRFKIRIPVKWQIDADEEMQAVMQNVANLTRHSHPNAERSDLVKSALKFWEAHLLRKRHGKTDRPQKKPRPAKKGHVTNAVRRTVYERDDAQCTFVDDRGQRCPARGFLELDHRKERARGGGDGADNVRVSCQQHNLAHAEKTFGREYVARRIALRRAEQAKKRAVRKASTGPPPKRRRSG